MLSLLHNSFSCRNLNFLLSSQNLETYLGATQRVRDLWDLWYRVTICHVSLIHTYPYTHIISNCSLEELQELHSIDRSVVRLNAKWEVFLSLPYAFFILFGFSFFTPTTQGMSLSAIKIQQSFPQLLTHYPRLCLQIRRRRVKACVDPKQLWGSYSGSINSPYIPLCAAAFIKVEHALMHTHPRPHPYPCPCACITHSGVNNSNGEDKTNISDIW